MHRNRVFAILTLAALAGCGTVRSHWPFARRAEPPVVTVNELNVQAAPRSGSPTVLQFWQRNTLVVNLQSVAGTGEIALLRQEGNTWPARVAFQVAPGRFEALEVRGAQRIVLPVSTAQPAAVLMELPPGTYTDATTALAVKWGALADF
jgi:hypothetical protein